MQLYALDLNQQLIFAKQALKQQDYSCLECGKVVRIRSGQHRHTHFYHLASDQACRLNGKSMIHLQVQFCLNRLLPDSSLECRFPEIKRIADLVWWPQKLIFEVQCSSIKAEEVEKRNSDYASLGFQVIWILHERKFNQWRVTAAENHLESFPHYFTDIDEDGNGVIYDQYSIVKAGMRKKLLSPLPIEISIPQKMDMMMALDEVSCVLKTRLHHWKLHFKGDLISQFLSKDEQLQKCLQEEVGNELLESQRGKESIFQGIRRFIGRFIVRPYSLFFQIILEKACK